MIAVALCLAALAFRGVGTFSFVVPAMAGAAAIAVAPRELDGSDRMTWVVATLCGVVAFGVIRAATPGVALHTTTFGVFASVVAAVGEELLFRHALYAKLLRWGVPLAIGVAALLFGLIHVPVYGWAVVPIDVAAGVLFGWQRWVTGGWSSPAVTHVSANLMGAI